MASLAQLPELVGFFSYSREDDEAFRRSLSSLREAIQRDLGAQLGRNRENFRLWQDQEAIAPGQLWESRIAEAIEEAAFFIPIITPRAVSSKHCRFEFERFIVRERALGRNDLVFPIHYNLVPDLLDEAMWRDDPVLSMVAKRQYVDWLKHRNVSVNTPAFRKAIDRFCGKIAESLRKTWTSADTRRQLEADEGRRVDDQGRVRQGTEARREGAKQRRPQKEAQGKTPAEGARRRQDAERKQEGRRATTAATPARGKEESHAPGDLSPVTAAQARPLEAGDSFKEGADCPEMIVVPAGRFLMGSPAGQGDDDERPQHEVTIARPFAVAKFALTFDEWDACAAHGGCRPDVSDKGWGRGRRPVINVSWDDAQTYVKWLSRVTGKTYRLLSEAEYEYAARAGSEKNYPWGDEIELSGKAMANWIGCGGEWGGKQTAPVGSFPANAFGLYDMAGNVWEWTEDCWNESYRGAPADGSAWRSGDCSRRVVRGGSWNNNPVSLRSAYRFTINSGYRYDLLGFRVARTLTP